MQKYMVKLRCCKLTKKLQKVIRHILRIQQLTIEQVFDKMRTRREISNWLLIKNIYERSANYVKRKIS